MKNSIPTLRNFVGGIIFGMLVLALMVTTVGCSSKAQGNDSGSFIWGSTYGGAPSLGQYVANSPMGLQLALQFNSQNGFAVGPVWSNGQLYVRSGGAHCSFTGDFITPGLWRVDATNQTPAYMNYNHVSNLNLIAYGPHNQVLSIRIGRLDLTQPGEQGYLNRMGSTCNGAGGFEEMYGSMEISLNGRKCLVSFIDVLETPNQAACQ